MKRFFKEYQRVARVCIERCELEHRLEEETLAVKGNAGGGDDNIAMAKDYLEKQSTKLDVIRKHKEAIAKSLELKTEQERKKKQALRELVSELAAFKEKEASQKQVVEIIHQALGQLDQLRAMWERVGDFFSEMGRVLDRIALAEVTKFVETGERVLDKKADSRGEWILSRAYRRQLASSGQAAARTTVMLQLMTEAFCNISERHLKPMTEEFSTYLALHGPRELEAARASLDRRAEEANGEIACIVGSSRDTFLRRMRELGIVERSGADEGSRPAIE